jgi:hypothetical protein
MQHQQHQQEGQQGGVLGEHSAARVCVPKWQAGEAAATELACRLERLLAAVDSWVGGVTSPAAHATLAAAGGGDLQQFRQQLEALPTAQQAVRQEGVSDASLSALAQQLQATGVMLSSIAVPHFCNNPACVNISGPQRCSWYRDAAAFVRGAASPATVGGSVSGRPGSSTSPCARRWQLPPPRQQQLQQPHRGRWHF